MGRGRGGRGGKRGGGRGGAKSGGRDKVEGEAAPYHTTDRWTDVPKTNVRFETYYRLQGILSEEEWPLFLEAMHDPLPTTFRITGSRAIAAPLNQMIKDVFVPFLSGLEHEGIPLSAPKPLAWYPDGYAWQLNIAKQHIRKNEAFRKFQHFLVYETEAGNLSRQEAVSMLPPLLLDIQPHHLVLDMCAAPGSKSVQLLEALHALPADGIATPATLIPSGLLIANDSDAKRCHMLVHQSLHRVPAASMMVTNHDATQFPGFRVLNDAVQVEGERTSKWKAVLYDRILADVPCSGDGTMRKNLTIWRDWSSGNGAGLHPLQLRILLRGIALLKPGGRIVYSTCSMNPTENEAVVSAALSLCPDMSILPVSDMLPSLIRRPGLTTWKVVDSSITEVPHPSLNLPNPITEDKKGAKKVWASTLWPKGNEKEMGLEHCWRLYPHLQDTGAFFVCVLVKADTVEEPKVEKKEEAATPAEVEVAAVESTKRTERAESPSTEQPEAKRVKTDGEVPEEADVLLPPVEVAAEVDLSSLPAEIVGAAVNTGSKEFKEEPVVYLSPDDEQVKSCIEFFDLSSDFPVKSLLVRNATGAAVRTIYLSSDKVRSLLVSNSHARMRVISCGVKAFSRQDNSKDDAYKCKWRILAEGLEIIRPYMGERRLLKGGMDTLKTLLSGVNILFADFEDKVFAERLTAMENGSCVLEIDAVGEAFAKSLVLPLWRSKASVNLMVEKGEKSAMSLRLYGVDVSPDVKPKAKVPEAVYVAVEGEAEAEAEAVSDQAEVEIVVDTPVGAEVTLETV